MKRFVWIDHAHTICFLRLTALFLLIEYIFLYSCILVFLYSCIPLFLFLYACIPVFMYSCILVFLCSCIPVFLYSCISVFLDACIPVFLYSCIHVFLYSCIPVFLYSCIPVFLQYRSDPRVRIEVFVYTTYIVVPGQLYRIHYIYSRVGSIVPYTPHI